MQSSVMHSWPCCGRCLCRKAQRGRVGPHQTPPHPPPAQAPQHPNSTYQSKQTRSDKQTNKQTNKREVKRSGKPPSTLQPPNPKIWTTPTHPPPVCIQRHRAGGGGGDAGGGGGGRRSRRGGAGSGRDLRAKGLLALCQIRERAQGLGLGDIFLRD